MRGACLCVEGGEDDEKIDPNAVQLRSLDPT